MSCEKLMNANHQWLENTWIKLEDKLYHTAVRSRDKIPYSTKDGVHDDYTEGERITWWTNGFWGGLDVLRNKKRVL